MENCYNKRGIYIWKCHWRHVCHGSHRETFFLMHTFCQRMRNGKHMYIHTYSHTYVLHTVTKIGTYLNVFPSCTRLSTNILEIHKANRNKKKKKYSKWKSKSKIHWTQQVISALCSVTLTQELKVICTCYTYSRYYTPMQKGFCVCISLRCTNSGATFSVSLPLASKEKSGEGI